MWPFTRVAITAAVLGLAAHHFLGWQVSPKELLALPWQMFGVLSILAMISFALADLYLLAFLLPLYTLAVLNDRLYGASHCVCRVTFRIRSPSILAVAGLCGEILLLGGLACALRAIVR